MRRGKLPQRTRKKDKPTAPTKENGAKGTKKTKMIIIKEIKVSVPLIPSHLREVDKPKLKMTTFWIMDPVGNIVQIESVHN